MRVFVTSDLHLLGNEPGGDQAAIKMARYICTNGTSEDVLLLLGDYGNSLPAIQQCLKLFFDFRGKKLVVFGNHDLWEEEPNTFFRLEQLIALAENMGFYPLDRNFFALYGIAFVGSVGWYDYSLRDRDGIPIRAYQKQVYPGENEPCWNDCRFTNWHRSDKEVTHTFIAKLRFELSQIRPSSKIIVGLHHVPTKKLLFHPRFMVPAKWRFTNAFLGSNQFSSLFRSYQGQISHVFCGHIHTGKHTVDSGIYYTSIGSTYRQKELTIYDPTDDTQKSVLFT